MKKGFSLIELLVTIVIILLVLGGAYITYITILKGFFKETTSIETQIETSVGTELLRLDIEHAGFGLGSYQPDLPIELNNSQFIVRTNLNSTNIIKDNSAKPVYWALLSCDYSGYSKDITEEGDIENIPSSENANYLYLSALDKKFISTSTNLACPQKGGYNITGKMLVIPYDSTATNGCNNQFCYKIIYKLSSTQDLKNCNSNTRNLLRAVGKSFGEPLLNCVSSIKYTFDIDTDENGTVDLPDSSFENLDVNATNGVEAQEIRNLLKKVNIYILVQEGKEDGSFNFTNYKTCSTAPTDSRLSDKCVEAGDQELPLPKNFEHYRWKVIKLSVKPMDL